MLNKPFISYSHLVIKFVIYSMCKTKSELVIFYTMSHIVNSLSKTFHGTISLTITKKYFDIY